MTPEDIKLVQASWSKVTPIAEQAAMLFYNRLFEIEPSVKELFKGDMQAQGRRLMAMIDMAVVNLHQLDKIIFELRASGVRHVGYGVKPEHYQKVGTALLWTLEQGLKEEFTPEVKAAWISVYGTLSSTMIAAGGMA